MDPAAAADVRRSTRRDIADAIRYVAHNGGVWRALPADFPPWQTVYDYHARWVADGTVSVLVWLGQPAPLRTAGQCEPRLRAFRR